MLEYVNSNYFDFGLFLRERNLDTFLSKYKCKIQASEDYIVFENLADELEEDCEKFTIKINNKSYGMVFCSEEDKQVLQKILVSELHFYFHLNNSEMLIEHEDIIVNDIDQILESAGKKDSDIFLVLKNFLLYLRVHVPFENCSIYIENVKGELGLLCGINEENEFFVGEINKNLLTSDTIGHLSYINQKIYHIPDPKSDDFFKNLETQMPKNYLAIPIAYHQNNLGVLNLSNLIINNFSNYHLSVINRFNKALSHLIYQYQIKDFQLLNNRVTLDLKNYVSQNIFEEVAQSVDEEANQNKNLSKPIVENAVMLFADIRSFTSISETLSAVELVRLLNIYFDALAPIITESGGTIDKFVGDMISAFWNVPRRIENPESVAIKTALKMQSYMVTKVAPEWKKSGVPFMGIGIGLNSGKVLAGHIGSKGFNNYTVVGQSSDISNFLESKARPGEIWVHENMFNKAKGSVPNPKRIERNIKYKGLKFNAAVFKPVDYPDYTKK